MAKNTMFFTQNPVYKILPAIKEMTEDVAHVA